MGIRTWTHLAIGAGVLFGLSRFLTCCCAAVATAEDACVRVWNGNPAGPHLDILGGEVGKDIQPVRIVGARNGCFSGKVVVSAVGPLKSVSVTIGGLEASDHKASIPAAKIRVCLGTGWLKSGWLVQPKAGSTFDILNEDPSIEELKPLAAAATDKYHTWVKPGRSYLPVWVTVAVPAEAAAGEYAGTLQVARATSPRTCPFG